jgi:hypothetical protein
MTLPSSGNSISFTQIKNEFGLPPGRNLGSYRIRETYGELTDIPLDEGIPQSGTIKFSDFHSKKLNIVVDCYSGTPQTQSSFHFDSLSAASTGVGDPWFRVYNSAAWPNTDIKLIAHGNPGDRIRVFVNVFIDDFNGFGTALTGDDPQIILRHEGADINYSRSASTVINASHALEIIVGQEYTCTIKSTRPVFQVTSSYTNGQRGTGNDLPEGRTWETRGICLRDNSGSDCNANITIFNWEPITQAYPQAYTSIRRPYAFGTIIYNKLFSYNLNPYSASPINLAERYGITPINLRDYNGIAASTDGQAGTYTWSFTSVSIPQDGYYRIKCTADDNVTVTIGTLVIQAGLFPSSEYNQSVFLNAATYSILVQHTQTESGSIQNGNVMYFALTIDKIATFGTPTSALYQVGIKNRFINNYRYVVGGFTEVPNSTSGKKVIGHVATTIGGAKSSNRASLSLRTGSWDSGTEFILDIGPSGKIIGAGGDGGTGSSGQGGNASNGTTALGVVYPTLIRNRGYIQKGYGGGGGGGGASWTETITTTKGTGKKAVTTTTIISNTSSGGGGGGGAGLPAGIGGGVSGAVQGPGGSSGLSGANGGATTGGYGGYGGSRAGRGGQGGGPNFSPDSATSGESGTSPGGNTSVGGYAIVYSSTDVKNASTVVNTGTITGITDAIDGSI